jgi:hypothetical protein
MNYGDLYSYLEDNYSSRDKSKDFTLVENFAKENNISFSFLVETLRGFGCYDDMEVMFNMPSKISWDTNINEKLMLPAEYAELYNLYCKLYNGEWIVCDRADKDAVPDLNRAYIAMFGT